MNFSPSKTSMTLCRCNTQANALMHECPGPKGMWMLAKDFGEDADTLTNTDESPNHLHISRFVEIGWEAETEERSGEPDTDTESSQPDSCHRIEIEIGSASGKSVTTEEQSNE